MEPKLAPGEKPLFCTPEKCEGLGYPGIVEDQSPQFDSELSHLTDKIEVALEPGGKGPSRGYIERWRLIARYHAAGLTNNQIARKLGYSAPGISLALQKPWMREEIERYRTGVEYDVAAKLKEAADDGIAVVHEIILNENEKAQTRLDASKWAIEKAHGKAKQEVSVESGTLGSFMDLLREMKKSGEVLDVTPQAASVEISSSGEALDTAQQTDKWNDWLDANLPTP